ncbi:MAG: DUF4382 domain-containing protein [Bdellovibrionota bacterium]
MKQLKAVVLCSLSALVISLAFQNCGQQGSVDIEPGSAPLAKTSTETMIINPDANDNIMPPHNDDGLEPSDDSKGKGACARISIADILLKIESIRVGSGGSKLGDAIALDEIDASISMNKLHVTIKATKEVLRVKDLFMVLKADGNKVLDNNTMAYDLKTPSGQTAGLKVHLDSEVSLKAGEIYSLQFSINPSQQIVSNPVKCLFRPVIKSARIVVALVDTL